MIISTDRITATANWLRAGVLFMALAVLPLGLAYAHDTEAVGHRLRAAVKAGEISGEQAHIMMDALKRADRRGKGAKQQITRKEYERAEREISEAVKAGEISGRDARIHLGRMRRMMAEPHEKHSDFNWPKIKKRIEGAVKRDKLTREEADAKYRDIKKYQAGEGKHRGRRMTPERYAEAEEKIKAMVQEGNISEEDARIRLGRMRRMMVEPHEPHSDFNWPEIKKRIEGAVKRDKLTRGEADAKCRDIKKRQAGEGKHHGRRMTPERYAEAEKKIKAMVQEGKISEEDARIRLGQMRRMMAKSPEKHSDVNWPEIKKRIEGAVERGDMTRDEADAKYRAIKKRGEW